MDKCVYVLSFHCFYEDWQILILVKNNTILFNGNTIFAMWRATFAYIFLIHNFVVRCLLSNLFLIIFIWTSITDWKNSEKAILH